MSWFEEINRQFFIYLNAPAAVSPVMRACGVLVADWVIIIIPLVLIYLYFLGQRPQRVAAVSSVLITLVALACGALIGWLYPHPRPFAIGLGHQLVAHTADASFPSDHGLVFFSIGLSLYAFSVRSWGLAITLLGVLVGWSRIFVGVHYPFDILGALLVSGAVVYVMQKGMAVTRLAAWIIDTADQCQRRLLARRAGR